jgi:hypothetical protein
MPNTKFVLLSINNRIAEVAEGTDLGITISYQLEPTEDFMSKQGADAQHISLPATKNNDVIFGTFHNPQVEDLTPNNSLRDYMPCVFSVNGTVPVMAGYALLQEASFTEKPEKYEVQIYPSSSEWVIDLQNVTLWDCVNPNSHEFTVSAIIDSWTNYGTTPDFDYVYAPVRYRQPFDGTTLGYEGDNCVNIYHLRPSISAVRLMQRAFNNIGYTIVSQFLSTHYAKGLVLPWVWGDFYDINSQLVEGVCFKAAGAMTTETPPINGIDSAGMVIPFWSGTASGHASLEGSAGGSSWWMANSRSGSYPWDGFDPGAYDPVNGPAGSVFNRTDGVYVAYNGIRDFNDPVHPSQGLYVITGNGNSGGGFDHFEMPINYPPDGQDNFGLYTWNSGTGTLEYVFNPPPSLVPSMTGVTATFVLSMYISVSSTHSGFGTISLEVVHQSGIGLDTLAYNTSLKPSGGAFGSGTNYPSPDARFPLTPTNLNFEIPNMNPGDTLYFRLRIVDDGSYTANWGVFTGAYLNNNPAVLGVPSYSYNPVTESFQFITPNSIWAPLRSNLVMTGFLVKLGGSVNLQNYDVFRNYNFLDFLAGMVDMFNLEITTNNIDKVVYIEPMFEADLPNGETADGYVSVEKVLDYSNKLDFSQGKGGKVTLFNGSERQIDLTFKLDGSDGGQTIWAQRYKNIYLSNRTYTGGINTNNINIDPGIISAQPGSARYMLPNRFAKGNRQMQNRFFSAVMHVNFPQWKEVTGVTPQLICIFPENTSSENAVTQSFTPKLAFYGGIRSNTDVGGWIFIGDPASPNASPTAYDMPFMFAVNYVQTPNADPVLSYSDENVQGAQVPGLLTTFYRKRFAIMRNGQLVDVNLRLNLNDVCNWAHKESIFINGVLYVLLSIDGYNPLTDDSTPCTLWKMVEPQQVDIDNTFPSSDAILTSPAILPSPYDLRYAPLMLYPTDLPQIG